MSATLVTSAGVGCCVTSQGRYYSKKEGDNDDIPLLQFKLVHKKYCSKSYVYSENKTLPFCRTAENTINCRVNHSLEDKISIVLAEPTNAVKYMTAT